jgi:hypothetical protein
MSYTVFDSGVDPQPIIQRAHAEGFVWEHVNTVINQAHIGQSAPHTWRELEPLLSVLKLHTDNLKVSGSFYHLMHSGSWVASHSHPKVPFKWVCTYYPVIHSLHTPLELYIDKTWTPIDIKVNQCIVFDKSITHRVQPQATDHPRLCIALNF